MAFQRIAVNLRRTCGRGTVCLAQPFDPAAENFQRMPRPKCRSEPAATGVSQLAVLASWLAAVGIFDFPKLKVAGSNPVSRSKKMARAIIGAAFCVWAQRLRGSSPIAGAVRRFWLERTEGSGSPLTRSQLQDTIYRLCVRLGVGPGTRRTKPKVRLVCARKRTARRDLLEADIQAST